MGDLLTSFNGTAITYDEIGNPISYYNGSSYTFTWTGRQLTTAVKGSTNMSFTYDDNGIRTSKTVDNVKHSYYLSGSLIVAEQWSDKLIIYLYDSTGSPIGMMYRTTSYAVDQWDIFWFEKNLQGDIVAIYNSSGTKVATYTYTDAWGNHSVSYTNGGGSTGAQYNPFRYRGYYYDTDLGMYYLRSRYYDPNTCRFINADSALYHSMLGYNMFAYCENNTVNYYDPTGKNPDVAVLGWGASAWWLTTVDGLLPIGDAIFWGVLGILAVASILNAAQNETPEKSEDKPNDPPSSVTDPKPPQEVDDDAKSLPNQGSVTSVPGAPPVDAGKQGKHVPGHNNDKDPNKTKWPTGKNGVRQTQEAYQNSKPHPTKPNTRIGVAGDGTVVEIKVSKTGIHGYPIFP